MLEPSDEDLLHALRRGDGEALGHLFRRHERPSYRLALALTASSWDAEELVGIAFLELWRRRQSVPLVDGSVRPWLFKVVTFAAKNQVRGQRRYVRLLSKLPAAGVQLDHAEEVGRVIDALEIRQDVRVALGSLAARDAAIVVLVLVDGRSYADTAMVLGVPIGTVKSALARAKRKLRGTLHRYSPGAGDR